MSIWRQEGTVVQQWAGSTPKPTQVWGPGGCISPPRERCAPSGGCSLLSLGSGMATSGPWNVCLCWAYLAQVQLSHTGRQAMQDPCVGGGCVFLGSPCHLPQRMPSEAVTAGLMASSTHTNAFSAWSRHSAVLDLDVIFPCYSLQGHH